MATKKQKATTAPASKKPVAKLLTKAEEAELARQARIANRAAKSAENKAKHVADRTAAADVAKKAVEFGKALGRSAVEQKRAVLGNSAKPITQIPGRGRPWLHQQVEWTKELEEDLFVLMSTGHGMQAIANIEGMPSVYQMMTWFADKEHPFSKCRVRAQESLVPFYEELAKDIAMSTNHAVFKTRKQVVTRDGDVVWVTERREADNVARSALAVSTLQWTLSHLQPKKHGRNPDQSTGTANEQLKGLFDSLKAGPVKAGEQP